MMMMKRIMYLLLVLISFSVHSQNESLFEQGKEAYKNGNYQEAVDHWKKIIDGGQTSANLYYNLGNGFYKLNMIGPSIYYYEKALQLDPADSDIKNNLAFAENARIDSIEPLPQSFITRWSNNISGYLSTDGWAGLSVSFIVFFATLFLSYYFSSRETSKRLLFTGAMVILFLFGGSLFMAFNTHSKNNRDRNAIIFANRLEIKSEPRMGSSTSFALHEGTKVRITAEDGDWVRIHLADGKDGWAPASELKEL